MLADIQIDGKEFIKLDYDLAQINARLSSFKTPLDRAVRQVMAPAIQTNFVTQGHGSWAPLAWQTMYDKDRLGYPPDMLVRTGTMKRKATQIGLWNVSGHEASYDPSALPPYSVYHIEGTRVMPQRDFTEMRDAEADAVVNVFDVWIGELAVRYLGF